MKLKCPLLLKPLATIVQENSQSFYPSEPFRIYHFTMRNPVYGWSLSKFVELLVTTDFSSTFFWFFGPTGVVETRCLIVNPNYFQDFYSLFSISFHYLGNGHWPCFLTQRSFDQFHLCTKDLRILAG